MNLSDQRTVFALVLIAVGAALLVPGFGFGWVIQAAVGVYLVYLWYTRRQTRGQASPWLLAIGVVLLLAALDRFYGFRIAFLPALLIVAGLGYLLDSRSQ